MLPMLNRRWRLSRASGLPSLPRLDTSFMPVTSRLSCGLVTLPPRASSIGPKLTVNAICCSSVSCWPGKTSTAYLSMPASIAATSCGVSGLVISTPVTSPAIAGVSGRMERGMGVPRIGWALSHYPFRPRPRQPFPQCALCNARKRRPRPTAFLLHQRRFPVGGGNAASPPGTTRARLTRRGPAPRQSARVRARRCPVLRSRVAHRR